MTIETLAEKFRLKITRDECNDKIIPGRRGHLYVDGKMICAMWLNTRPIIKSRLTPLGGRLWMGDISLNDKGVRVQDIWVKGVLPEQIPLAIRLTGCKRRRIVSEAMAAALAKAQAAAPAQFQKKPKPTPEEP